MEYGSEPGTRARCEMDSHADTCVAGPNFTVIEFTGEHCDVTPYTADYQPILNVSIGLLMLQLPTLTSLLGLRSFSILTRSYGTVTR